MRFLSSRRVEGQGRDKGQGLVEFAIVLPVFLVLVFAALDVGRVIWAQDDLAHAAREAARYASVHGGSKVTSCPTGPNLGSTPGTGCPTWTPDSKEPTRIQARAFMAGAGSGTTVTVCYYTTTACTGNSDEAGATNGRGEFVTVRITSHVSLVTTSIVGHTGYDITATSTVLINN
ncbi:MAG: pilus assembly protein [Chloroflexi bacterium]|nr:pilus assembly protein [Chloroflexota bacterium]